MEEFISVLFSLNIKFVLLLVFVLAKIGLCCLNYCVMRIAFIIIMPSYTDIE